MKARFGWLAVVIAAAVSTSAMAATLDLIELDDGIHLVRLGAFLLLGVAIGLLSEGLQRARQRAATSEAALATSAVQQRGLEASLRQAQKLEALGMLAGGIAHDFNNLLAVVAASNALIGETLPRDAAGDDARELVDEVGHAVERGTALTRQLLTFSRRQVFAPVPLDLPAAIGETHRLLTRLVGPGVELVVAPHGPLPAVSIDPGAFSQILINLCVNARDAMPDGGRITIAASQRADRVALTVDDTGSGMAPEVVARAFEPFFTTKPKERGTGMGLSVVHGIVQQAGGTIAIESGVGAGTRVHVDPPAPAAPAAPAPRAAEPDAVPRGHERILVVDDEELVRRATARSLRRLGYDVVEAADGVEALARLRETAFDLLLTDVEMPHLDGRQLVERARRDHPATVALVMSGHTNDEVVRRGASLGDVALVHKPFRIPALARRMRDLLDDRAIGQPTRRPAAAVECAAS